MTSKIRQKTMYQTTDGKMYENRDEAKEARLLGIK